MVDKSLRFCTVVNCMDGRIQEPVSAYLKERFGVDYVDGITEPGPNGILARGEPQALVDSIVSRVRISVEKHGSVGIAVVGHFDCAGNPGDEAMQNEHTRTAIEKLHHLFDGLSIIGLYVDEQLNVKEVMEA